MGGGGGAGGRFCLEPPGGRGGGGGAVGRVCDLLSLGGDLSLDEKPILCCWYRGDLVNVGNYASMTLNLVRLVESHGRQVLRFLCTVLIDAKSYLSDLSCRLVYTCWAIFSNPPVLLEHLILNRDEIIHRSEPTTSTDWLGALPRWLTASQGFC